jgi:AcrR family transcriptional regulator
MGLMGCECSSRTFRQRVHQMLYSRAISHPLLRSENAGHIMTPPPAGKKKRISKKEQRDKSLEEILDAAEYLFSRRGIYGVSFRDVANQIGVHSSLLGYYFDSKQELYEAVFARRAEMHTGIRMEALDRYEAEAAGNYTVAGALHAFLDTDLDSYIGGGEKARNYGAFGAQISATPEFAELMDRHFDPLVRRLIGILKKALPDCADEDLFWGYHFVSAALMQTIARTGRIDRLSGGLCLSDDLAAVKARITTFMTAGFIAVCRERKLARDQGTPPQAQ